MAKKPVDETTAMATQSSGALAERPDFLKENDTRGSDHITREDLQMPRLALAQQMSPQLDESSPVFIEGLKQQDLFNDLTKVVYGRGPIDFTVLRADPPRYIEFHPRDAGGGIKDMNVPADDPRTRFNGNEPPVATKFYDFIIMLLAEGKPFNREIIALSLKGTGLKVARRLNGLMKTRNAPIFAGRYSLTTAMAQNAKGKFAVYQVGNNGWVDKPTFEFAEQAFEGIKDKKFEIAREPGTGEEDTDFPHGANAGGQEEM